MTTKVKLSTVIAHLLTDLHDLAEASGTVKIKRQAIIVNILWLTNEGHLDKLPEMASALERAMKTVIERKGLGVWISQHLPLVHKDGDYTIGGNTCKKRAREFRTVFHDTYNNDYELWASDKVKVEKKDVDWVQRLDSAMNSLQDPDKGDMKLDNILLHIIEKEGIQLDTFMRLLAPKDVVEVPEELAGDDAEIAELMAEVEEQEA